MGISGGIYIVGKFSTLPPGGRLCAGHDEYDYTLHTLYTPARYRTPYIEPGAVTLPRANVHMPYDKARPMTTASTGVNLFRWCESSQGQLLFQPCFGSLTYWLVAFVLFFYWRQRGEIDAYRSCMIFR